MASLAVSGFQIIWINLLLSGDNAVVIALACRNLDERQRRIGMLAGAGAAVFFRIIFTLVANSLLGLPWIKFVGGLLLLWIAIKLILDDEDQTAEHVKPAHSLGNAIRTIAVADLVMSLDNVLAIAAVAQGHLGLIVFGLLISIPLVVAGSQLILLMIKRAPWIVWAGAALLGWVAGEILTEDAGLLALTGPVPHAEFGRDFGVPVEIGPVPALGAVLVLLIGYLLKRRQRATA